MNNNNDKDALNRENPNDDAFLRAAYWMDGTWFDDDNKDHVYSGDKASDLRLQSCEQADHQLLHALLHHHHESEGEHHDYVDRGLARLDSPKPKLVLMSFTRYKKAAALVGSFAASIGIFMLVFVVALPSQNAVAALDQVINRISQLNDRHYHVTVERAKRGKRSTFDTEASLGAKNKGRKGEPGKKNGPKPRFEVADLYLRGTDQFVFIEQRDDGKGFIKGRNADKSWQVKGAVEPFVSGDVDAIKPPISSQSGRLAFLNISHSLEQLKEGYSLIMAYDQAVPGLSGEWVKVTAEKIDKKTKGAKRVFLYYDEHDYTIGAIVFDKVHLPGERALRRITLTLRSQDALPHNFFDSQAHITGGQ